MGVPAGSTGVRPQGSEEDSVGGRSHGWLRDRMLPEGTGDQGSAEGQEEPLGSMLGLRPEKVQHRHDPSLTLTPSPGPSRLPRPSCKAKGSISQILDANSVPPSKQEPIASKLSQEPGLLGRGSSGHLPSQGLAVVGKPG